MSTCVINLIEELKANSGMPPESWVGFLRVSSQTVDWATALPAHSQYLCAVQYLMAFLSDFVCSCIWMEELHIRAWNKLSQSITTFFFFFLQVDLKYFTTLKYIWIQRSTRQTDGQRIWCWVNTETVRIRWMWVNNSLIKKKKET